MKNVFFLLTLTICLNACQQTPKTAANPALTIKKMFPTCTNIEVDTVGNGDLLIAFEEDGHYSEAFFQKDSTKNDALPTLIEIRKSWSLEKSPTTIHKGLAVFFQDFEVENIANLEKIARYTGGGASATHFYDVEYDDGENYVIVELDEQGNVIKSQKTPISDSETQQKEEEGVEE